MKKLIFCLLCAGGGGYDYITVDSAGDRLYVSHGMQVNVLNKETGDSIGVIRTEKDVHGIALVHALGKGYITNGRGKSMTVIDPATDQAVATIQLTGWPETAVSDGAGKLYVNNAEKNEIDVIDASTYKIINTWPIAPGEHASGLAIDRQNMRLFAGCDNKLLVVMNALTGKVVQSLPIDDECDAVGFDHTLSTVYSSNGEGTLTIIRETSPDSFTVLHNLKTKKGARTQAVDQTTHKIYLPTGEFAPKKTGEFRPSLIPGSFQILVVQR